MKIIINRDMVYKLAAAKPELITLNQGALGAAMGIDRSHVSRLLSGKHRPTAATLEALAKALGVEPSSAESVLLKVVTDEAEA